MNKKLDDLDLRRALLTAAQAEFDEAQATQSKAVVPSPDYVQEPQALPTVAQRKIYSRRTRSLRVLQRVACVFLVGVFCLYGLWIASPTSFANMFPWVITSHPQSDQYINYDKPLPKSMLADWYPTYIPEGFVEVLNDPLLRSATIYFENSATQGYLDFGYMPMQEGYGFNVNNENVDISDVTINGLSGRLMKSTDGRSRNMLIWMDEANRYRFLLSSHTLCEELMQIAESVEIVE